MQEIQRHGIGGVMGWILDIIVEVAKCIGWLCVCILIGFGVAWVPMEII